MCPKYPPFPLVRVCAAAAAIFCIVTAVLIGRLERVLVLANPLPAEPIKRPTLSVPVPVVEEKKTRAPRGSLKASAAESSRKKRLATLYHDQSRENSFAEVETVGKRKRREEIKEVLAAPAENTLIKHVPISTNSSSSSSLANDNLYTVLNTVFDVFWSMEIDESDVNHAFFSRISKANCAEYGLKSFSSEACCLAVVKVRRCCVCILPNAPLLHLFCMLYLFVMFFCVCVAG